MGNDCLNYLRNCPKCIKFKGGTIVNSMPKKIIVKGSRIRYVTDDWKLPMIFDNQTGFLWVIDIIDYFCQILMFFPVVNNNTILNLKIYYMKSLKK